MTSVTKFHRLHGCNCRFLDHGKSQKKTKISSFILYLFLGIMGFLFLSFVVNLFILIQLVTVFPPLHCCAFPYTVTIQASTL